MRHKVRRSDMVVVSSYAVTFILLGVWMMAAALDYFSIVEAFVLWLASVGAVMLAIGAATVRSSPGVATLPMGTGGFLVVMGLVSYFVMGDSLSLMMGLALVIIICSSMILIIYLTRYSLEKE
ncbi:MAG: hypothetical protein V1934_05330 [Methanobacteriota archaeon]